jgi:preprotein translocase subunit YajC
MNLLICTWTVLASIAQDGAEGSGGTESPSGPNMFVLLGGVLLIFYFLMWRPQAKERRKREAMMGALKKGDKVLTSSGMYGSVVALSEREVTVKVDEKTGTKIRFARSAIQHVLNAEEPEGEKPA